jgi:hypothetical protein
MPAMVLSCSVVGLDGARVGVEVDLAQGRSGGRWFAHLLRGS